MNDLYKLELVDSKQQTPIEVLLGIDNDGRTTARKLYEFLELDKSNYSRWCKKNILDNTFAEENIDFWAFVINDEWGGQSSIDYKLTASFAKKLAMTSHTQKGEQARNYFLMVENKLKQVALSEQYKLPSTYKEALQELLVQVEENERLEDEKNKLEVELDYSKQWYTVKRVANINNINWKTIDWKRLKEKSYELNYEIRKIFDANYGQVNSYHYKVWKAVYPSLKFIY